MSDKMTPRGIKLVSGEDANGQITWFSSVGATFLWFEDGIGKFYVSCCGASNFGTEAECLAWIDARAEETFRALGAALHGDAVEDVIENAIRDTHDLDVTDAKYARAVAKALGLVQP